MDGNSQPMKPARFQAHVYDKATHTADSDCPQKWFWCRIHWWTMFESNGEKWYARYPLTVNRNLQDNPAIWSKTVVYCGPGTFYPKPANNGSYAK